MVIYNVELSAILNHLQKILNSTDLPFELEKLFGFKPTSKKWDTSSLVTTYIVPNLFCFFSAYFKRDNSERNQHHETCDVGNLQIKRT